MRYFSFSRDPGKFIEIFFFKKSIKKEVQLMKTLTSNRTIKCTYIFLYFLVYRENRLDENTLQL